MTKFKALAAAAIAAFAVSNANALYIAIDDFNSAPVSLADITVGGGAATTGAYVPVTPTPGVSRMVSHELLAGLGNDPTESWVKVGTSTLPAGSLEVNNAGGRDSAVTVMWTLGAGLFNAVTAAKFGLNVVIADGNPATVTLKMGTETFGSFNLGTDIPTPNPTGFFYLMPEFTASQRSLINAGGVLEMSINGPLGWDLSVDSAGFEVSTVPEPTSLALVGLALLGAGVASRRRAA